MNILRWLMLATIVTACGTDALQPIVIKGTVRNLSHLTSQYPGLIKNDSITLYLIEVPFDIKDYADKRLDSQRIAVRDTAFLLEATSRYKGVFDIVLATDGPVIPLIHDTSHIEVAIDFTHPEYFYTVRGSLASQQLRAFIVGYINGYIPEVAANKTLDSLKMINASDSMLIEATNQKNNSIEKLNAHIAANLTNATNPYASLYIAALAERRFTPSQYEKLLFNLLIKFPENEELIAYKKQYERNKDQQAALEKRTWMGKSVPEFSLPDTSGIPVALTSFKGKYVLIDFWASWCRPCRLENPNVVAAYAMFKDKNFTVLGVSLDKRKEPWMDAIHSDHLTWTHISDLAFWNSEAVNVFGFEGIPFNLLIDPQGKVVAEGLRGSELPNTLSRLLK